ncbi:hypothetical protein GQ53DRAFT_716521 [Thozetella sp. PMI_491]|nr:hypothetical protein GQ53DRAFT_716521 [Thozetella sp. PMI_491]
MAATERPVSPVRALRDSFGDPRPPDISRKITACVACRKQKIKCHMRDSQPPCVRCKKRGLSCTVNRSLQMLLESDTSWKYSMEQKMKSLQSALGKIAKALPPDVLEKLDLDLTPEAETSPSAAEATLDTEPGEPPAEIVMDLDSSPGAFPGHHLSRPKPTAAPGAAARKDLVAAGIISAESAQTYFDTYKNRLDHFVYRILAEPDNASLERIRASSPLLTAAVCAVGALHLNSQDFDLCYKEFVSLSGAKIFSRDSTVDDVRALCIGAFWLSDLSWPLVGAAVRIATELQLHKSFFKALQGDRQQYLRTRLYLSVYACDHHFSVAYGRPPMTRECEVIRDVRKLLDCEHATEDDARLVSQVLRWSFCSNVYDTFGADVERPFSDSQIPQLRRFIISLDSLRAEWGDRFIPNAHVGNYPRKGVGLQYHFAKLYLCSHVFRGGTLGDRAGRLATEDTAWEMDEIANFAVLSAVSILRAVSSDTEIQSYLDGLPTYFHIMVAFAAVFLLKVSTKLSTSVQLDVKEIQRLMHTLVQALKKVTATMHPRHLLVSITKGIDGLLLRSGLAADDGPSSTNVASPRQGVQQALPDSDVWNGAEFNWSLDPAFDPNIMDEYDFLVSGDMSFDFNSFMDRPTES